ncbi:MAG: MOSC domain-containing protein [Gammaproteobacteria bacterium]
MNTLPQQGQVRWIGLRPARREPMEVVTAVRATVEAGLAGDRFSARAGSPRQVTLIQWEHLRVIASLLGRASVEPASLRRNIAVSGINLLALKGKRFFAGGALLECTGVCAPCSRMEEAFGAGGYNAVRGHGGITARVLETGKIELGDEVAVKVEHA